MPSGVSNQTNQRSIMKLLASIESEQNSKPTFQMISKNIQQKNKKGIKARHENETRNKEQEKGQN